MTTDNTPPPPAGDTQWKTFAKILTAVTGLVALLVAQPLYSTLNGDTETRTTGYGNTITNQRGEHNVNQDNVDQEPGAQNDSNNGNTGNIGNGNSVTRGNSGDWSPNSGNSGSWNSGSIWSDDSRTSTLHGSGNINSGDHSSSSKNTNSNNANSGNTNSVNTQHNYNEAEATAGEATVLAAQPADGKPGMGPTALIEYTVGRRPSNGNRLFLVCTFIGTGRNDLHYAKEEIFGLGPGAATARFGGAQATSPDIIGTTRVCGMVTADTGAAAQLRQLMLMDQQGIVKDTAGQSLNLQRRALPAGSSPIGNSITITIQRTAAD